MITAFVTSIRVLRQKGANLIRQPCLGQILITEPALAPSTRVPEPFTAIAEDIAAIGVRLIAQIRPRPQLGQILTQPTRRRKRLARVLRYVPLLGDTRHEQMAVLAQDNGIEVSETVSFSEELLNRRLGIAMTSLGITSVALLIYPPLQFLALPLLLHNWKIFFTTAYEDLIIKHKVSMASVDALAVGGLIVSLNLWIASLTGMLMNISFKVIHRVRDNSQRSLVRVFSQQPTMVWVRINNTEVELPFTSLQVGDLVVVQTGQVIPIDGVVVNGAGAVDQHVLTGESQLVEKAPGDEVLAATVLLAGRLVIQVNRAGEETSAARIATILQQSSGFKSSLESRSEILYNKLTYPTLAVAGLALATVGMNGAIAALGAAPGYLIRVGAPLALLNYLQILAHQNILVKDGAALESLTHVQAVIFDKTGTLTIDQPHVSHVYSWGDLDPSTLLTYAAAIEQRLSHPLARAIVEAAQAAGLVLPPIEDARYELGYGLQAAIGGRLVLVGSERFMQQSAVALPAEAQAVQAACHNQGLALVYVAIDGACAGALELVPTVRPEAREAVAALKHLGLTVYIISGDQEAPTRRMAEDLGIEHYFASVLPEHKAALVKRIQAGGQKVCFVGDGINDSIALCHADVSISLRGASTVATDTAQIILMTTDLTQIPYLFRISRELDANLNIGLGIAVIPNIVLIGGIFFLHYGILAALAYYNVSLILSVGNAMRPVITHRHAFAATDDDVVVAN